MDSPNSAPRFRAMMSIVIAVYDDWGPLDGCLQSLADQDYRPDIEVIVADDGSGQPAPDSIWSWNRRFALTILRQPHLGISSARNLGVRNSKGDVILFVDADCRFQSNCLATLRASIVDNPQHDFFQLRITGDCSGMVGKVEHLRLTTLQNHLRQSGGLIRYLNTAGFAVRRAAVNVGEGVFDPAALRAEDTLLLATIIENGKLPLFVPDAMIEHAIQLSLVGYFLKDMRSAYTEVGTYKTIASKGVRVRVGNRDRISMLRDMWDTSADPKIGRPKCFVLAVKQALRLIVSLVSRCLYSGRVATKKPIVATDSSI
jgi:glycosyltransferase involved in cell wall biosynthesis